MFKKHKTIMYKTKMYETLESFSNHPDYKIITRILDNYAGYHLFLNDLSRVGFIIFDNEL